MCIKNFSDSIEMWNKQKIINNKRMCDTCTMYTILFRFGQYFLWWKLQNMKQTKWKYHAKFQRFYHMSYKCSIVLHISIFCPLNSFFYTVYMATRLAHLNIGFVLLCFFSSLAQHQSPCINIKWKFEET